MERSIDDGMMGPKMDMVNFMMGMIGCMGRIGRIGRKDLHQASTLFEVRRNILETQHTLRYLDIPRTKSNHPACKGMQL